MQGGVSHFSNLSGFTDTASPQDSEDSRKVVEVRGDRVVDGLKDRVANESKTGYTCATQFVRDEIRKDAELIETGQDQRRGA